MVSVYQVFCERDTNIPPLSNFEFIPHDITAVTPGSLRTRTKGETSRRTRRQASTTEKEGFQIYIYTCATYAPTPCRQTRIEGTNATRTRYVST